MDLQKFSERAKQRAPENKKFLAGLKRKDPRRLDDAFHSLHDQVFAETDCLECANCCKTTSPIFYQTDIERVAEKPAHEAGRLYRKVSAH